MKLWVERICLLFCLVVTGCATLHFHKGISLQEKGDVDGAIVEYRAVLRLNPNDVDAHNGLGVALQTKGDVDGAIVEYRTALRLDPNYVRAHRNLGVALRAQGKTVDAKKEFTEVLRLLPDIPAYQEQIRFARQQLRELEYEPSSTDVNIAVKAYSEKQYDIAFAEFSKLAAQGDVVATRYLAIMYLLGQGTAKDERRGMELSSQCAQAGDSSCMVQAAESALLGRGTPVNLSDAREWAGTALGKGDVRAGLYLARAYLSDPNNRFIIDGKADQNKYQALARRPVAERADQIEALDALAISAQGGFIPARLLLGTLLYEQSGGMPSPKVAALFTGLKDLQPMYQKLLSNTQQVLALGETRASPRLVQDSLQTVILSAVGQATRAGVKDVKECKDFKLTHIANVTPLQDVEWLPLKQQLVANTYPLKGTWTEDWTVNLCNASYTVHMQFQADGLGGAYHSTRVQ